MPRSLRHVARCHHSVSTVAFFNKAVSRFLCAASGVASVMATRFAPSRAAQSPANPRPAPISTTTVCGVIAPKDAAWCGSPRLVESEFKFEAVASHRKSPREYAHGQITVLVPGTNWCESDPSCRKRMGDSSPPSAGCVNTNSRDRWSTPWILNNASASETRPAVSSAIARVGVKTDDKDRRQNPPTFSWTKLKAAFARSSRTSRGARATRRVTGHTMAPSEAEIAVACADILTGLDHDTLEYVAGGLLDDEVGTVLSCDDLVEFVAPMLDETCGGDEALARAMATSLWERLVGDAGTAKDTPKDVTRKAPISLGGGEMSALEAKTVADEAAARAAYAAPKVVYANDGDGTTSAAAAKEAARAAQRRALLHETAQIEAAELNADLHRASELAARMRIDGDATGSRLAAIELGPFQLPNPGGGADLLDDAVLTLTPGHRYGLIGRNGKGKSTLLKFLASRRVGGLDPSVSVHYVTQEVSLTETQENALPADVVLAADIERVILLQEVVKMEAQDRADLDLEDETGGGGGKGGLKKENPLDAEARRKKLAAAHERLIAMDANGAPARASHILRNLGFNESLSNRKLKDLSGGWRVRVALAAALFAKPYVLRVSQILTPTFDALYGVQSDITTTAIRATQYRTVCALYKSPITRLATDLFLSHSQRFAVTRRTDEPPFNRGGALAGEGAVDLENVANANRGGGVPRPSLPGRRHHGLAAHQRRRAATHAAQDVLQRVGGEEGGAAEEFGKAAISAGGEEETPGGVRGARV